MNIGFDGYFMSDKNGAWGKTQYLLCKYLSEIDKENVYYVFSDQEGSKLLNGITNVRPIIVKKKGRDFFSRRRSIERAVKKNRLKLDVFIETVEIPPRLQRKVAIYTIQHDFSNGTLEPSFSIAHFRGKVYRWYQLRAIRNSTGIFCNSNFTRNQLMKIYPEAKNVLVFPYGVDPPFEAGTSEVDNDIHFDTSLPNNYFLFVGRITVRHKNVLLLMEAFIEYIKSHPDFHLIICSTEDPTEEQRILMNKIGDRFIFFKNLSTSQIMYLYKRAHAFIFPSWYEGFGVPIIEAQYMHCPLILNDIPVFREVSGECAIFFDGSVTGLVSAMDQLTSELRIKLIHCGLENCKKYSWKRSAEIIYRQISRHNSGASIPEPEGGIES